MSIEKLVHELFPAGAETNEVKKLIFAKVEDLVNQNRFAELVQVYILTFLEVRPTPAQLKIMKLLSSHKLVFNAAKIPETDPEFTILKVLQSRFNLRLDKIENQITRTIVLLIVYLANQPVNMSAKPEITCA